jgi:hypothetical protein
MKFNLKRILIDDEYCKVTKAVLQGILTFILNQVSDVVLIEKLTKYANDFNEVELNHFENLRDFLDKYDSNEINTSLMSHKIQLMDPWCHLYMTLLFLQMLNVFKGGLCEKCEVKLIANYNNDRQPEDNMTCQECPIYVASN